MRPLRWPITVLSLVLALTGIQACGDGGTGSGIDAGPRDAGAPPEDASRTQDAGTADDAGDAGVESDAGVDADGDGVPAPADCDDSDPDVHPGADELCNDVDDDCDGTVDEDPVDPTTFFRDADGDGYGGVLDPVTACNAPAGYVTNDRDCDDTDRRTNPDAAELCDGFDDDCDGAIDEEALDGTTWYVDADGDGFGSPTTPLASCAPEPPTGYSLLGTDCDDSSAAINPAANELCSTVGVDDDCDGMIDESSAADAVTWYRDADRDTYGDPAVARSSCTDPSTATEAWVTRADDCNDGQASWHPGASDLPDDGFADSNCDGMDGDAEAVVFVAAGTASCGCVDGGATAGSRNTPFCSITPALDAASARGLSNVVVAGGSYTEPVTLRSGIAITGGYYGCYTIDGATGLRQWRRSLSSITRIVAPGSGNGVTMEGTNITRPVRLDGLTIEGPNMASVPSAESIALRLVDVAAPSLIVLRNVRLVGGQGGHGANGANGSLSSCSVAGGTGGHRTSGDCGSNGGSSGASSGAGGGAGGSAGASYCTGTCGTLDWDGLTPGSDGQAGGNAPTVAGGAAPTSIIGTFATNGDWTPVNGTAGAPGLHGGGGGGGGQGGSRGQCACIDCCWNRWGGAGGTGGRGGCGGMGGAAGGSGGPSIALQLVRAQVTLENAVAIQRGFGGRGGSGGNGGNGEGGQAGSPGGSAYRWTCGLATYGAAAGGRGGNGGAGSGGGGGAGGNGGASWGIARVGPNTFVRGTPSILGGGGGNGGVGGRGGRGGAGAYSASGANGSAGPISDEVLVP